MKRLKSLNITSILNENFQYFSFLTAKSLLDLPFSVDFIMLRRKPTRLELKLDDIEEFESIRKDLEVRVQLSNP